MIISTNQTKLQTKPTFKQYQTKPSNPAKPRLLQSEPNQTSLNLRESTKQPRFFKRKYNLTLLHTGNFSLWKAPF